MPENMTDSTTINLGAGGEPAGPEGEALEIVVVIVHDLSNDTYTVETDEASTPAESLDEALNLARAALEGSSPEQVRDEVANEVYPKEGGMV